MDPRVGDCLDRLTRVAEENQKHLAFRESDTAERGASDGGGRDARYVDKVNALAGLESKQKLPVIKDRGPAPPRVPINPGHAFVWKISRSIDRSASRIQENVAARGDSKGHL